ncbi:MAG: hypothetical protein AVDCRST_MAG30-3083 [uncultured Solirubrobacteraceae bacterium]|uniref:Uncharacterized protein n=1 Tax=uncultured Solirubrobacteraceae bacterium TaxID=1162706 RepID=A0A6J4TG21_9ACTN|nr:MAG: hypothetical protein AVDCRST_MAG30-3083 [uncultured Solirubrobacteraceae bacterium]
MRMRQSLAEFESALHEEIEVDRTRREHVHRHATRRAHQRELDRVHKRGSLRFVALVAVLIATAVLVTVAMFQALYYVMG